MARSRSPSSVSAARHAEQAVDVVELRCVGSVRRTFGVAMPAVGIAGEAPGARCRSGRSRARRRACGRSRCARPCRRACAASAAPRPGRSSREPTAAGRSRGTGARRPGRRAACAARRAVRHAGAWRRRRRRPRWPAPSLSAYARAMLSTGPGRNKVRATTRAASLRLFLGGAGDACWSSPASPIRPRRAAPPKRFLDAHYVHIDLPSALPFTSGAGPPEGGVGDRAGEGRRRSTTPRASRPCTTRCSRSVPTATEAVSYVYRGRIAVDGADSFERRWLVTVRQEAEGWRVTNYQEFEQ